MQLGLDRSENGGCQYRGIGAKVAVTTNDGTQTGIRSGGTNIASGGPPTVHFGPGDAEIIEELVVTWPDGGCSTFRDIPTNQKFKDTRED